MKTACLKKQDTLHLQRSRISCSSMRQLAQFCQVTFTEIRPIISSGLAVIVMTSAASAQSLAFNERAIRFGPVEVHDASTVKVVAISNTTGQSLFLSEIATTADFTQTNNCSKWLAPGSGCLAFVRFAPRIAGPRSGELVVRLAERPEETLSLSGDGGRVADPTTFRDAMNDEELAQSLLNDSRYSFESLLSGKPEDVRNAERIFALTRDTALKQRLASILVSRSVSDPRYSKYLNDEAEEALLEANTFPWPRLYDAKKQPMSLNAALNDWCQAHNLPFWDVYHIEYYDIPVAWYYLAPAGDRKAYDLLVKGLRSPNLMIAANAAHGLAKLQDPRGLDELIAAGKEATGEAVWAIVQALTYFPDPKAQAAAEALTPEPQKTLLNTFRADVSKRGLRAILPW
jgi:hypothetical protein